MYPDYKESFNDIVITVDGKPIGEIQSLDLSSKVEVEDRKDMTLMNRGFTATLENVEINPEFINMLRPTKFTVVGIGYLLPRGNKLPKKKRIRKKWMKKYRQEFTLENCMLVQGGNTYEVYGG